MPRAKVGAATVSAVKEQLAPQLRPFHFQKGQSGNPKGREPGSRNKLDEEFVKALYEDFKEGGVSAIKACRTEKPDVYLNVIAKVLPKQVDIKSDETTANLADSLSAVAAFLSSFAEGDERPGDQGALPNGSVLSTGVRAQAH